MANTAANGTVPETPEQELLQVELNGQIVAQVEDPDDPSITAYQAEISAPPNTLISASAVWFPFPFTLTTRKGWLPANTPITANGKTLPPISPFPTIEEMPHSAVNDWEYTLRIRAQNSVGWSEYLTLGVQVPYPKYIHDVYSLIYPDGERYDRWTGEGSITVLGITYTSLPPNIIDISGMVDTSGAEDNRVKINLSAVDPETRVRLLGDPGIVEVIVGKVTSDNGTSWQLIPRSKRGYIANAQMAGGIYSFEVATGVADYLRGNPEAWSHIAQVNRTTGVTDNFFQHLRRLELGVSHTWPPTTV